MNEIKKAIDIYEKLSDEEKEIALKVAFQGPVDLFTVFLAVCRYAN